MKNYFNLSEIKTVEELKKVYRALCLEMHPDKGGNTEDFQEMQNQYEDAAAILSGETPRARRATTQNRRESVGFRRGTSVIFYGYGMNATYYIITSVNGDEVKLVRLFGRDFQSLEDVEYFDEESDRTSRRTFGKYDHMRPLSEKFGIGYYWDDQSGKTYTEEEINEAERVADNFDKWIEIKKQHEAEEARRAQEEADRAEAEIIAQWRDILEQLPPLYKSTPWDELKDLPREQRKAIENADRKAERRVNAQRLAAFKRNIKAVFAHYFPGVKVSVSDTSKCWCESSVISWVDGPTVDEVKAVEAFDYFRACGWVAPGPCDDYGHTETRRTLQKFRDMFGAWSDDSIKFERTFSDETAAKVDAVIASIIPDYEGKKFNDKIETTDEQATELIKFFGFEFAEQWHQGMTEAEEKAFYSRHREHEEQRDRIRRVVAPSCQQWRGECYWQSLRDLFISYYKMTEEPTTETATDTTTERPQTEGAKGGEEMTEAEAVAAILAAEQAGTITRAEDRGTFANGFDYWDLNFSGRGTFAIKKALRMFGVWCKEMKAWHIEERFAHLFAIEEPTTEPQAEQTTEEPTQEPTEPQTEEPTAQASDDADPLAEELAAILRRADEIRALMAEREAQRQAEAERLTREAEKAAAIAAAREEAERAAAERAKAHEAWQEAERLAQEAAARLSAAGAALREATEANDAAAARLSELMGENDEPATPSEGVAGSAPETDTTETENEPADEQQSELIRKRFADAAKEADELEDQNEHTAEILQRLRVFYMESNQYGKEIFNLIEELEAIAKKHEQRGHILPTEYERRIRFAYRGAYLCRAEFGEDLGLVLWGDWAKYLCNHPEAANEYTEDEENPAF